MFKNEASKQPEILQDRFSGIRAIDKEFVKNTKNILELLLDTLKTTFWMVNFMI